MTSSFYSGSLWYWSSSYSKLLSYSSDIWSIIRYIEDRRLISSLISMNRSIQNSSQPHLMRSSHIHTRNQEENMFSNNQSLVFKQSEETAEHSYEELKANFISMRRRQAAEKSRLLEVAIWNYLGNSEQGWKTTSNEGLKGKVRRAAQLNRFKYSSAGGKVVAGEDEKPSIAAKLRWISSYASVRIREPNYDVFTVPKRLGHRRRQNDLRIVAATSVKNWCRKSWSEIGAGLATPKNSIRKNQRILIVLSSIIVDALSVVKNYKTAKRLWDCSADIFSILPA